MDKLLASSMVQSAIRSVLVVAGAALGVPDIEKNPTDIKGWAIAGAGLLVSWLWSYFNHKKNIAVEPPAKP